MITGRIVKDSGTLLYGYFYVDGVLTSASGTVSVVVTKEDGTSVTSGTATSVAVGTYSFSLPVQTSCNVLTVAWTGNVGGLTSTIRTRVEVVGGRYCTLAEVRALDGLSDTNLFPVATLEDAIRYAEDTIDRYIGVPYTHRYARETFDGDGSGSIMLHHTKPYRLLSVKENGTSVSFTDWALYDHGLVVRDDGFFATPAGSYIAGKNIEIQYEYGYEYPPDDIAWCARTLARYYCVELFNRLPDRSTAIQNEYGTVNLAMAGGQGRPTALPDVNAILNRYRSGGGLVVG